MYIKTGPILLIPMIPIHVDNLFETCSPKIRTNPYIVVRVLYILVLQVCNVILYVNTEMFKLYTIRSLRKLTFFE